MLVMAHRDYLIIPVELRNKHISGANNVHDDGLIKHNGVLQQTFLATTRLERPARDDVLTGDLTMNTTAATANNEVSRQSQAKIRFIL